MSFLRTFNLGEFLRFTRADRGTPVGIITWATYEEREEARSGLRKSFLQFTCFLGELLRHGWFRIRRLLVRKMFMWEILRIVQAPNVCVGQVIRSFDLLPVTILNAVNYGRATLFEDQPRV